MRLAENLIADKSSDLKTACAPYFSSMMQSCYRLLCSINHLCEDARVSSGIVHLNAVPMRLAPVIGRLCRFASEYAACLGLTLRCDALCPHAAARVDPEKLERMTLNLLSNALKYTRPGGAIDMRLYQKDAWACIEVENEGEDISPSLSPHLFERFCTGETDPQRGTGLGLFIVRELARLHGGDAFCAQPKGHGARFVIRIPAIDTPPAADVLPDDAAVDRVRMELAGMVHQGT